MSRDAASCFSFVNSGWKENLFWNSNSQANHASSSSLLLGAGSGAPAGPSVVGSRTEPSFPNGFSDLMDDRSPVCLDVFTGTSARRDHPSEFMESLNEEDAMFLYGISTAKPCQIDQIWTNVLSRNRPRCDRLLEMDSDVGERYDVCMSCRMDDQLLCGCADAGLAEIW